jgi:hypothetical protein
MVILALSNHCFNGKTVAVCSCRTGLTKTAEAYNIFLTFWPRFWTIIPIHHQKKEKPRCA